MKAGQPPVSANSRSLVLPLIISVLFLLALGLVLVWLNLERTKLSYQLNGMQKNLRVATEYNTKETIERDQLLSPAELTRKAVDMGLHTARPGQLRRVEGPDDAPVRQ